MGEVPLISPEYVKNYFLVSGLVIGGRRAGARRPVISVVED